MFAIFCCFDWRLRDGGILKQLRSEIGGVSQVALFFVTITERTGNTDLKLWQERLKSDIRKAFLTGRVMRLWNSLSGGL